MKRKISLILMGIIACENAFSGVRTLYTNDRKMEQVVLKLDKSTVLRFPSTPRKAVLGNLDKIEAEFIGRDLTLRPKGMVETNLFVYTKERIFGFLIRVGKGKYDDLVHVKWRLRIRR